MWQQVRTQLRRVRPSRWPQRLSGVSPGLRRGMSLVLVIAIIASMVTVAIWPASTSASLTNVLYNGGFEQGFSSQPGCGMVGSGWQCFTNGGAANYGFYDDQWDRVVAEGKHSQLLELNTKGIMLGDADRYSGIYQTVPVVDWAEYTFSLKGIIRTTNLEGDKWRYRVQVGWSFGANPDWTKVTNWTDVGWDKYYLRTDPGAFSSFTTRFMAESDYVTMYVRVWKKWGVPEEELDVNFDAISLTGPSPYYYDQAQPVAPDFNVPVVDPATIDPGYGYPPVVDPSYGQKPVDPGYGYPPVVDPGYGQPLVVDPGYSYPPVLAGACVGPNLVYNGDFERGFNAVSVGKVGNSWGYFTNGGGANFGFYDDEWYRVRSDGAHSQLIEINSKNIYPVDNDRYAGIYQYITGLHPGVTYELTVHGLLRGEGNEDDPYRFEAQWGFMPGYSGDWKAVGNWTGMNFGPISKRTDPAPLAVYTAKFVAPSPDVTIFIRGWKKWGIPQVEMDFNIDGVSLTSCGGHGGPVAPVPPIYPPVDPCTPAPDCGDGWYQPIAPPILPPVDPCTPAPDCGGGWYQPIAPPILPPVDPGYGCTYVVQPGDTLASIAYQLGVSMHELIYINNIVNPDFIFVGQILTLPGCAVPVPLPEPLPCGAPVGCSVDPAPGRTYTVQPGDTLSQIAAWYGVSAELLCEVNGLWNPNIIFVGQVLIIP